MPAVTSAVLLTAATAVANATVAVGSAIGAGIAAGAGAVVGGVGAAAGAVGMTSTAAALSGAATTMGMSAAGMTGAMGVVAGVTSAATTGATVGAASGGAMAGLTGGDLGKGMLRGAAIGAATGGLASAGGMVADSLTGLNAAANVASGTTATAVQTWGHFAGTALGGTVGAKLAGASTTEAVTGGIAAGAFMTPGLSSSVKFGLMAAGQAASGFLSGSPEMQQAQAVKKMETAATPQAQVKDESGKVVAAVKKAPSEQNLAGSASGEGFVPSLNVDNRRLDRVQWNKDYAGAMPGVSPAVALA